MKRWSRVFGTAESEPDPDALVARARALDYDVAGHFRRDDQGWFEGVLSEGGRPLVYVDRYLAHEDGIRAELNTWAAWLETAEANPHTAWLMEHMIGSKQVFTLHADDEAEDDSAADGLALELARWLAQTTAGVYQADGAGFFAADGTLLVEGR